MTFRIAFLSLALLVPGGAARAQDDAPPPAEGPATGSPEGTETPATTVEDAAERAHRQLQEALAELAALERRITEEKLPLNQRLRELEAERVTVRDDYQETARALDGRLLAVSNLNDDIRRLEGDTTYLSNLLSEYLRKFESFLHITELQRYADAIETARLAPENAALDQQAIFAAQAALLALSLERIEGALGGDQFEGRAVDPGQLVKPGQFLLLGPAALFRSEDGDVIGTAELRLGSLEPTIVPFELPEDAAAALALVETGEGQFPLDPTLGNAHKIAATEETLLEHIQAGGPVMYPIFGLAGAALLVALYKWLRLTMLRHPSRRRVQNLLTAVSNHDAQGARDQARNLPGPVGSVLRVGTDHLGEPRELIEEVMYENVLTTRLELNSLLPFIAISAAAAPLLGLLGTVTGIINTFKMITVFGSGDVKTLSGGISEALVTTEFGLIVAIPSLLLHAFLSRKARSVVNRMETTSIAFVNAVSKSPFAREASAQLAAATTPVAPPEPPVPGMGGDRTRRKQEVRESLLELLSPEDDPHRGDMSGEAHHQPARAISDR